MTVNTISLSDESVIRDTPRKLDYHMCCFFFSRHSQSVFFRGRIFSLTKLIQEYGNDAAQISNQIQITLYSMLKLRFDTAEVRVTATESGGSINVVIDASVSDNSDPLSGVVSVGFSLAITDSVLKSILSGLSDRPIYEA